MSRNSTTAAAGAKLLVFTIFSVLVTGLLTVIMGNISFEAEDDYAAVFTTASMLEPGDDVRVAGIPVGKVDSVDLHDRTQAKVSFTVESSVELTEESRAEIRYLNIVGDRYLALVQGDPQAERLPADSTIPVERTSPALDLTALYNGFQPLFAALEPDDVNQLSMNIVQVLQGEGGTVRSLLANTASLTNSLADRDQLIGEVVTNLDTMLATVDGRRAELDELVVQLRDWMTNLADDRDTIGTAVQSVSRLTGTLGDLLQRGRPLLASDVTQLRKLMTLLAKKENIQVVTDLLDRLPEAMTDQTRIGTYGSWYNYYLCDFSGTITLPDLGVDLTGLQGQLNDLSFHSTAPRCQ